MKVILLGECTSTNDEAKEYLRNGEDVCVCAERQTAGRGTKGRSFSSLAGGVYLSFLTFYSDVTADKAFQVMMHAAVSVCRTAEHFGVRPTIKWPNDVRAGGKKLCGILIENALSGDHLQYSIVGIGLNVNNDLSSLGGIAVSLSELSPMPVSVGAVRDELIAQYSKQSTMEEYLSYVSFLGEEIGVTEGSVQYRAIARRILPDGRLEVERDGKCYALSSAEIVIGEGVK